MSLAEELLDSTSPAYSTTSENEPHIVVGNDRVIVVPEELKKLAVQYDHRIEKITFDCPRYWDEHDLSQMHVYVNYERADGEPGSDLCTNVTVDENDETMMHFDWEITGHLSAIPGSIAILVCTKKSSADGKLAERHWNSERNTDCYVSEGLEADAKIYAVEPGIIDALLTRMENVDLRTSDEALNARLGDYINKNPETMNYFVSQHMSRNNNAQKYVNNYMSECGQSHVNAVFDSYDAVQEYVDRYIYARDFDVIDTVYFADTTHGYMIDNIKNYSIGDDLTTYSTTEFSRGRMHIQELKSGDVIEIASDYLSNIHNRNDIFPITNKNHIVIDLMDADNYIEDATIRYTATEDGYFYFSVDTFKSDDTAIFHIKRRHEHDGGVDIDKTLSFSDMAADAKVVGEGFRNAELERYKLQGSIDKMCDDKLYPLVESVILGDIVNKNVAIYTPNHTYTVGEYFVTRDNLSENDGYYATSFVVEPGYYVDFSKAVEIPSMINSGIALIVTDSNHYITDIVYPDDLSDSKTYMFTTNGLCSISSECTSFNSTNIIYQLRKHYDFDAWATKNDIKPDKTLTVENGIADAKVVGDKFTDLDDILVADVTKVAIAPEDVYETSGVRLNLTNFLPGSPAYSPRDVINYFGDADNIVDYREVSKNYILDISANTTTMSHMDDYFGLLFVNRNNIVVDRVHGTTLINNGGKYRFNEDGYVYVGLISSYAGEPAYELYPANRIVELESEIKTLREEIKALRELI